MTNTPRKQLLDDQNPPAVRSGPAKPVVVLVCGGIIAALLLIVVLNIDPEPDRSRYVEPDDGVIELIAPTPRRLSEADLAGEGLPLSTGIATMRAERGWIETSKRDGRPAQRYRTESLNPAPEGFGAGWLQMTQPRMELFSDTRIVTIAGDTAFAYAPQRAVEHGTVEGNVLVRVFDIDPARGSVDVENEEPSLTMRTEKASFENFLGEIRCDGWVVIESRAFTLPGSGLSVLIDDQNDEVRVTMAEVDYILLTKAPRERATRTASAPLRPSAPLAPRAASRAYRPAAAASAQPPSHVADTRFYLLSVHDNIRIDEGEPHERRTATGDRLEVIFSSKSEGLGSSFALSPRSDTGSTSPRAARGGTMQGPPHPMSVPAMLASAVLGATPMTTAARDEVESLLGPGITLIRCDGPLTIEPLNDQTRALASPEDARLELTGRSVRLCDYAAESEVIAQSLIYHTRGERIELLGSPAAPLRVNTPDMEALGEHFWLAQADGEGGFVRAGSMKRRDRNPSEWLAMACVDDPRPMPARIAPPQPSDRPELQITWEDGVDLQFAEGEENNGGRLRSAVFSGAVNVFSNEFVMDADQMAVRFPHEGNAEAIESIHATGDVKVEGVIERAAIRCDDLYLELAQTATGSSIPKLMIATGEVEALDEEQAIWAQSLTVTFREKTAAREDEGERVEGDRRFAGREAEVEELIAERDVQVLLADGTRAFADRLEGDGVSETVELTGESVMIVSDRMIVDQGRHVTLDRRQGKGAMPGPGRFRLYQQPVVAPPADDPGAPGPVAKLRADRPAVDEEENPVEVRARWREAMNYDANANRGAGSVDLHGDVSVVSDPSPMEHNTMTGEELRLDFALVERLREGERDHAHSRQLAKLTARKDAKIESHTWPDESREGEMRIFYVAGQHVEHHALTGESLVEGGGELLIHDPIPGDNAQADAPFGAKGSTMLTWEKTLRLTRRVDEIFDLVADRNVRLRHQNLHGAISTLICEELHATALRREADARNGEGARNSFDFGGSARLERVRGSGAVEIRTDQRTVHCDDFDYDIAGGAARLSARPPREVTIQTTGSPFPMHAEEAVWNMHRDTINITRARGGLRR